MVEFALVLPILLLLLFGIIDLGLMIKDSLALSHLAKDAARDYAVGSNEATVKPRITAFASAVGMDVSKLTISDPPLPGSSDTHVEVTLTYEHKTIAGKLAGLGAEYTLTGTGIHLRE